MAANAEGLLHAGVGAAHHCVNWLFVDSWGFVHELRPVIRIGVLTFTEHPDALAAPASLGPPLFARLHGRFEHSLLQDFVLILCW